MSELTATVEARVSADTKRKITEQLMRCPDRWENESHFLRSAVESFCRKLALEGTGY